MSPCSTTLPPSSCLAPSFSRPSSLAALLLVSQMTAWYWSKGRLEYMVTVVCVVEFHMGSVVMVSICDGNMVLSCYMRSVVLVEA